jgi:formylglycine-generating enzyme required for sulfatase activity
VYGEEALGLALARAAAAKAKGTPMEFQILGTLAWALVANGQDALAKEASARAYDLAPEDQAARYGEALYAIESAAGKATDELRTAEATVAELEQVIAERRTFRFAVEAQRFLHDTLAELLGKLSSLAEKEKANVEQRLSWAKQIRELTLAHPNARHTWAAVRAAIASNAKYAGQRIELRDDDVIGLVPIGENPVTHLWEFYDLRSACDDGVDPRTIAIPQHEMDGSIRVTGATGIVFVLLPGSTFWMGAQRQDPNGQHYDAEAQSDESPVHQVTLLPFFLARHELTRAQWQRLADAQSSGWNEGRRYDGDRIAIGRSHPADQMDWDTANRWMIRHGLCLPTEAQWEYGARAGSTTRFWSGDDPRDLQGVDNVHDQTSVKRRPEWGIPAPSTDGFTGIAPVGTFRANAFGLFDVHGNVREWCRDEYGDYDGAVRAGDGYRLVGDSSGYRVFRGGGYNDVPSNARSTYRLWGTPSIRSDVLGLRPARTSRPGD